MIPLSLYLHLPWCKTKCPYCDFNAHRRPDTGGTALYQDYARALVRELHQRAPLAQGRKITSVYFGGGTPNMLPPEWFAQMLAQIRQYLTLTDDCEITLEANPGKGRIHDFAGYAAAGINRVSLGVQSLHPETLAALGRDYCADQAMDAIAAVTASPITRVNFDYIFAAPQQTLQMLEEDLTSILAFSPTHLSCYELTIEPNTRFYSALPQGLPDDETKVDMFMLTAAMLKKAGLDRYEVSAFAIPGEECVHNLNYWQFGDYLALGAGAHAKITNSQHKQLLRYANRRGPAAYAELADFAQPETQQRSDYLFQFCLNAFRLVKGFSLSLSAERLFTTPEDLVSSILEVVGADGVHFKEDWIQLDPEAWLHQNQYLLTTIDSL